MDDFTGRDVFPGGAWGVFDYGTIEVGIYISG